MVDHWAERMVERMEQLMQLVIHWAHCSEMMMVGLMWKDSRWASMLVVMKVLTIRMDFPRVGLMAVKMVHCLVVHWAYWMWRDAEMVDR